MTAAMLATHPDFWCGPDPKVGAQSNKRAADCIRGPMDQFLAQVERRAFGMARLATRNPEEALDIVQDTMMGFVRRYAKKPQSDWAPLFFTVLNSRITDWYRRQSVRRRWQVFPHSDDQDRDLISAAPDAQGVQPDRALQSGDSGAAIRKALEDLPKRQRQTFVLRTWQGLSVAETAKVMGCSEGSVKTHLSRAMAHLREALQEYSP